MTEHLPECRLSEPCDIDIAQHGFCSMQVEEQFFCIHCMGDCICEKLRACNERVLGAGITRLLVDAGTEGVTEYGQAKYRRGFLDAVEQAADAILDHAKALGLKDNSPVVATFIEGVNALSAEH